MIKAIAVAGLAIVLAPIPARAQTQAPQDPKTNAYLLGQLCGGATLKRYLETMRREFTRLDADGDGTLDSADVDLHNAVAAANLRAVQAMRVMAADLDGDGAVTAEELRKKLRYDRRLYRPSNNGGMSAEQRIQHEVGELMKADANGDGRVTWKEAADYVKLPPSYQRAAMWGHGTPGQQLLALAPDGKALTWAQLEAIATAFFRATDNDHNGTISLDELEALRKRVNQATIAARPPIRHAAIVCDMPKASDAATVVLLSSYETEALSTVALGSQDDVSGVGDVKIAPGKERLYIVIASYRPTIWRFSGATERIERVVVTASRLLITRNIHERLNAAGVIGVPKDKVRFPKRPGCLGYFTEAPSIAAARAGVVKAATGKAPQLTAARYKVSAFDLPSGKIESVGGVGATGPVAAPSGNLEQKLHRYNPGGVVAVDAKEVVANVSAEPYEVLPQEAGLIQLIKSGALTENRSGEFIINNKIRLPAGLAGVHLVRFLLRHGVPKPDGDFGHSIIVSEDTGLPVRPR